MPQNTVVLVLGVHRSGTSALTGTLHRLGVSLGPRLLSADECNQRGYFESHDVLNFNHDLMTALGYAWDDPREMPRDWESTTIVAPFRARLRKIIEADYAHSPVWGVKDPRICRLLPFWLPVLRDLNFRVVALMALRHPAEVAGSLIARSPEMTNEHAELLWLRHNIEAEIHSRALPRASIDYANLVTNWREEFARAREHLGVDWPITPEAAAGAIDEFLGDDLRHQRTADGAACATPHFGQWLTPTYRALQDLSNPATAVKVDAISRGLAAPARKSAKRILSQRHGLVPRAIRKVKRIVSKKS
jgi:hypothetical protein